MTTKNDRWRVMRQDDNGNRFLVERDLMQEAATRLADELTNRGHKQVYWAEPMPRQAC